jgi:sialate O-acetylesterase
MEVLISSWRRVFRNEDMTFTIVQLPRWGSNDWFELRQLQKKAATTIPYCTYSVNLDCGEFLDIHPQDKEPIGVRAAQATLRDFYGMSQYKHNPVYKFQTVEGSTVRVSFDHVDQGLFFQIEQTRGGKDWKTVTEGTGFEIMDKNGVFHPATATLDGSTLVLTSNVVEPMGIRYAAGNFPNVSLFDKNGMPAEQFLIKFS